MNTLSLTALPSKGVRVTALAAVVLVLFMAVFSASPQLHARLHACKVATGAFPKTSSVAKALKGAACPKAGEKDDGCAITLFSAGLTLAVVSIFFGALAAFADVWARSAGIFSRGLMSRYWNPPLCGPP